MAHVKWTLTILSSVLFFFFFSLLLYTFNPSKLKYFYFPHTDSDCDFVSYHIIIQILLIPHHLMVNSFSITVQASLLWALEEKNAGSYTMERDNMHFQQTLITKQFGIICIKEAVITCWLFHILLRKQIVQVKQFRFKWITIRSLLQWFSNL